MSENYCRNPAGEAYEHGLWCYTDDPDTRWEECLPLAPEEPELLHGENGRFYTGNQNKTIGGRDCINWEDSRFSPNFYPDRNLVSNYCRNPVDADAGIWCDTAEGWEQCKPLPVANQEILHGEKNEEYRGTQAVTRTGKTC